MLECMPGTLLERQTFFPANVPNIVFPNMYYKGDKLYTLTSGFSPLKLRLQLQTSDTGTGSLIFQRAEVADFYYRGVYFKSHELGGYGGLIANYETKAELSGLGGLWWTGSGITLLGATGVVSSNTITLSAVNGYADVIVHATSALLDSPVFRLLRKYDTSAVGEVLDVGDGSTTHFEVTAANGVICPSSVQISFTDSGGAKAARIRDNGHGRLVTTPPEVVLAVDLPSTINYETGEIVLNFHADHIPTATNITMTYQHMTGALENCVFKVHWQKEV
jgi:hypothetical protein